MGVCASTMNIFYFALFLSLYFPSESKISFGTSVILSMFRFWMTEKRFINKIRGNIKGMLSWYSMPWKSNFHIRITWRSGLLYYQQTHKASPKTSRNHASVYAVSLHHNHTFVYQCQYSQVRQYNWLRSSQWHDFFLYLICFPLLFVTRELTWNVKKFRLNIFNMTGRRWKRRHSVWILICFHLKDFRHCAVKLYRRTW